MSRDRLEDLGRILVFLDDLLDNDIFSYSRHEDFVKYYLPPEHNVETVEIWIERLDVLHGNINVVKSKLCDCLEIAKGDDYLNAD